MSNLVPPAPVGSWTEREGKGTSVEQAPARNAASMSRTLDAAFLCRLHRSCLWFGGLCTLLVAAATANAQPTWSYAAGVLLGMALLASQSFLVQKALAGGDVRKRLGWWLLAPLKYLGVALLLGAAIRSGVVSAPWFAAGFVCTQFVIGAKVGGWVLSRQMKSVREVYVAPQKK